MRPECLEAGGNADSVEVAAQGKRLGTVGTSEAWLGGRGAQIGGASRQTNSRIATSAFFVFISLASAQSSNAQPPGLSPGQLEIANAAPDAIAAVHNGPNLRECCVSRSLRVILRLEQRVAIEAQFVGFDTAPIGE